MPKIPLLATNPRRSCEGRNLAPSTIPPPCTTPKPTQTPNPRRSCAGRNLAPSTIPPPCTHPETNANAQPPSFLRRQEPRSFHNPAALHPPRNQRKRPTSVVPAQAGTSLLPQSRRPPPPRHSGLDPESIPDPQPPVGAALVAALHHFDTPPLHPLPASITLTPKGATQWPLPGKKYPFGFSPGKK